eukprot:14199849-Heterocapsa_arctica.AAC.1
MSRCSRKSWSSGRSFKAASVALMSSCILAFWWGGVGVASPRLRANSITCIALRSSTTGPDTGCAGG